MDSYRILNDYKLIILLISYAWSGHQIIKRPTVDAVFRAKIFSDINDGDLLIIRDSFLLRINLDFEFLETSLKKMLNDELGKNYLKKFGVNINKDKIKLVPDLFASKRFLESTALNFADNIDAELKNRERKIQKLGISKGKSLDDSLLVEFNQRLKKCEELNDIEELLLYYTMGLGADLMNGFLKGDLSLFKSRSKLKASWGSSQVVTPSVLLDSAVNALKLRDSIIYGKIKRPTVLYRGVGILNFLECINMDENKIRKLVPNSNDKSLENLLIEYVNSNEGIIYRSLGVTSTTINNKIAEWHAQRYKSNGQYPIIMEIYLQANSTFGKDFRETSFSKYDANQEVILKPGQKIELGGACKMKDYISICCVTIP